MKSKYSIRIRKDEKELYHIFKDLERYGRTTFSYPDNPKKQGSIARSIGIRGKPLVERELFIPPTVTRWHKPPINAIQLPIGVKISEKKTAKGIHFYFKREK